MARAGSWHACSAFCRQFCSSINVIFACKCQASIIFRILDDDKNDEILIEEFINGTMSLACSWPRLRNYLKEPLQRLYPSQPLGVRFGTAPALENHVKDPCEGNIFCILLQVPYWGTVLACCSIQGMGRSLQDADWAGILISV